MDVDEEIREAIENMRKRKNDISEDMSDEELLAKIEKYKRMTLRVCEKIQEAEWKIQKTKFIAEYEKKKFDECKEIMDKFREVYGAGSSQETEEEREKRLKEMEAREKKLLELDDEIKEKRKRLLDMELTEARKKMREEAYKKNSVLAALQEKQEKEELLKKTLEEVAAVEKRLSQEADSD